MRRVAASAAMLVVLLVPASAGAVTITEFPIEAGPANSAHALTYLKSGPDGALWIVDRGAAMGIERLATSGARLPRGAPEYPGLTPLDIAVAPSGDVYVTESGTGGTGGGYVRERPGQNSSRDSRAGMSASAIAVDPGTTASVRLAFGANLTGTQEPDGTGHACTATVTGTQVLAGPCLPLAFGTSQLAGMAFAPDGRLWATDAESNAIVRFEAGVPVVDATVQVALPAGSGPRRIAIGADGNLWVTMSTASAIDRITPAGARTRFPLAAGRVPYDITAGPDGALWFTENGASAVGRITIDGEVREFPVPTPGAGPLGITTGPDGAIWFTENAVDRVGRLTFDSPAQARGPGGAGTPGVLADTAPPVFTKGLSVSRSRFRFGLSEPARVVITIAKRSTGRRVGGRCVKATRSNRRRSRCARYVPVGTLRRDGRQGGNEVAFNGRVHGRRLRGTYRASAVATDAAGNASRPSRVSFTVVSR